MVDDDDMPSAIFAALRKEIEPDADVIRLRGVNWNKGLAGEHSYVAQAFYVCDDDDSVTKIEMSVTSLTPDPEDIAKHLAILIREEVGEIT